MGFEVPKPLRRDGGGPTASRFSLLASSLSAVRVRSFGRFVASLVVSTVPSRTSRSIHRERALARPMWAAGRGLRRTASASSSALLQTSRKHSILSLGQRRAGVKWSWSIVHVTPVLKKSVSLITAPPDLALRTRPTRPPTTLVVVSTTQSTSQCRFGIQLTGNLASTIRSNNCIFVLAYRMQHVVYWYPRLMPIKSTPDSSLSPPTITPVRSVPTNPPQRDHTHHAPMSDMIKLSNACPTGLSASCAAHEYACLALCATNTAR